MYRVLHLMRLIADPCDVVRHRARAPDSRRASVTSALILAAPSSASTCADTSTVPPGSGSPLPSSLLPSQDHERELELKAFKRDAAVLNELLRPPPPRRSGRPVRSASAASQGGAGGPALMSAHVLAGSQGLVAGGLMSPQPGMPIQVRCVCSTMVRSLSTVVTYAALRHTTNTTNTTRRGGPIPGQACHRSYRWGSICRPRLRVRRGHVRLLSTGIWAGG